MKTIKQVVITAVVASLVSGVGLPLAKKHLINGHDIKKGTVTGKQVKFPTARRVGVTARSASAHTASSFDGPYIKLDPASVLQVTWSGTVTGYDSPCIYQLTVDGNPPSGGGGQAYVSNSQTASVSTQALFPGLEVGEHIIGIESTPINGPGYICDVGNKGIDTTVNVVEAIQ